MMATGGLAGSVAETPAVAVWTKTCVALKRELGEATFGSWLGQAALRERGEELCLVAATGVARHWIRRHAWIKHCRQHRLPGQPAPAGRQDRNRPRRA